MDFFEQEARARRHTRRLTLLFGLAVLAAIVLNYLILAVLIRPFRAPLPEESTHYPFIFRLFESVGLAVLDPIGYLRWLWEPWLAAWITLGTLVSVALGCLYKLRLLSGGGAVVGEFLGGRRIEPKTADTDERRLRDVVEEMAIASGTPVPEIYVLDNERGINAFAAGHTRDDVAVGVTRGALKLLTRDEMQGVIAHEFSHILYGDTRLNLRLMGLAHGLFWPTYLGRILLRGTMAPLSDDESIFDEDSRRRFLPTAPLGILFIVIGSVSLPFVRLLKSAICRQREWLADASAVQFTRNPAGIAGALRKIGGLYKHGMLDVPGAEVASHLYFASSSSNSWFPFLATHPPLRKRIGAIDPLFDGSFPRVRPLAPNQYERDQAFEGVVGRVMAENRKFPDTFLADSGNPTAERIKQASVMRLGLPADVSRSLLVPSGAAAVVFSLVLDDEDPVRAKQIAIIRSTIAPAVSERAIALAPQIQALGSGYKLALAGFAVPALRQHSQQESVGFRQALQQVIECDGSIDLFEYTLMKMVTRQLESHFGEVIPATSACRAVTDALPECALLLSALAHLGQGDEAEARKAFVKGRDFLDAPGTHIEFIPRSQWDLSKVDAALDRLASAPPFARRNILLACARTVAADGQVTERQAELLRAIADSLNCPVPPFVEALRMEELTQPA